jgi:SOS-response transcriptional repressor LexA
MMPTAKRREQMDERISFTLPSSMDDALRAHSDETGYPLADLIRRAIASYLDPASSPHAAPDAPDESRHRFLTSAPCGPWEEALERAGTFTLSRDVAEELGAREGDVVVRAVGQSMSGAGIPDGALLLMRPLANNRPPRTGRVALVQIVSKTDEYLGTIKRWMKEEVLHDGDGKPLSIPAGTKEIKPIAESVGLIALL